MTHKGLHTDTPVTPLLSFCWFFFCSFVLTTLTPNCSLKVPASCAGPLHWLFLLLEYPFPIAAWFDTSSLSALGKTSPPQGTLLWLPYLKFQPPPSPLWHSHPPSLVYLLIAFFMMLNILCICHCIFFPTRIWSPWGHGFSGLFCLLLYPQSLEQYLARSRCLSVEQMN